MGMTAHIIRGPGFIEDASLNARIEGQGYELSIVDFFPGKLFEFSQEVVSDDLVLLRAPWVVGPENFLYARLIANLLRGVKDEVLGGTQEKPPKLIATGRAALSAIMGGWAGEGMAKSVLDSWQSFGKISSNPWEKLKSTEDASLKFHCYVEGMSCPNLSTSGGQEFLVFNDEKCAAWIHNKQMFSFVDPLALFDGSQLNNYGYGSQEGLLKNVDFLQHCLGVLEFA